MSFIALRAHKSNLTQAVVAHADIVLGRAAGVEVTLEPLQLEVRLRC